jgi:hypothetical protein
MMPLIISLSGVQSLINLTETPSSQTLPEKYASLEQRAMKFFDKTRQCPRRLRWAAFDEGKFEELLKNVSKLNSNMMHFLESHDRERHFRMQEVTFMQVLQVNERINDLFSLFESLRTSMANSEKTLKNSELQHDGDKTGEAQRQEFEERAGFLARFKAMNMAVEVGTSSRRTAEISLRDLSCHEAQTEASDDEPRSHGTLDDSPVWLEWRYYQPIVEYNSHNTEDYDTEAEESNHPPAYVLDRISKMAVILRDTQKPAVFHVPDCRGYVHDPERARLGYVFSMECPAQSSLPITLLEFLSSQTRPSLPTRLKIALLVASSIWYLHSTDWVHKGLRSENIVFPTLQALHAPSPFLCGFDYSRPADSDATTKRILGNPWHELYRHPRTQFDVPREGNNGFRKLYDMYSLGVVLFEIGTWRPVHEILGLDPSQRPKPAVVKRVQSELRLPERLDLLRGDVGEVFASVVGTCLSGNFCASSSTAGGDSGLHFQVWEHVVKRLESISV